MNRQNDPDSHGPLQHQREKPPQKPLSTRAKDPLIYPTTPPKDPGLALLLSAVAGGGGYLYLGQTTKGVVIMIATILLTCTLGIGVFIPIIAAIDAYQMAVRLKKGQAIGQWECFLNKPSRARQLVTALLKAPPGEVRAIQGELISEGPRAYKVLAEAASKTSRDQGDIQYLTQTLELYERQASTEDLIKSFADVFSVDDEFRPPVSVRAEAALKSRGPSIISQLLSLLDKSEAVRFYAIRLLSAFDDPQTIQPALLRVVQNDTSSTCRVAALMSFGDHLLPDLTEPLIKAMKAEAKLIQAETNFNRTYGLTRLGLGLVSGDFGAGGLIAGGVGMMAGHRLAKKSKVSATGLLACAYTMALASARPFPLDELLSLAADPDKNVRAFMMPSLMAALNELPNESQRQEVMRTLVATAADDRDFSVQQAAIAVLAACDKPQADAALERLAQSPSARVRSEVARIVRVRSESV